jgi:O-antigen/teichoic acid export membrane protein
VVAFAAGRAISHRRLAAGAGAKLFTEALARVASFAVVLLAARQLGPAEFGTYLYGLGAGFVLAQGADLGLQLLVAREVAVRGRGATPLVRMALALKLGLAAVVVLLFLPLTIGHAPFVRVALAALGAGMVLQTFIDFVGHVFRGNHELDREVRLLTSTRLLAAAACGLILWLDGRLLPLALVTLAAGVAGSAFAAWLLYREGWLAVGDAAAGPGSRAQRVRPGDLIRAAVPLGVAIVLSVAYLRVGWLLLYHFTGQEAVAQLGAAQRLMEAAQLVPAAAMAAIFPAYASTLATDAGGARRLGLSSAGVLAGLGVLAAATLWWTADWAVPALFGSDYRPAIPVLKLLAISVPLMFVNYLLTHMVIARGSQGLVAWFTGAALAVHITASSFLIPLWGGAGVAASMIVAESVLLLCCAVVLTRSSAPSTATPASAPDRPAGAEAKLAGVAMLALLAGTLPFEVAVLHVPGFLVVTSLELLGAAAVVAALAALWADGVAATWRALPKGGAALLVAFLASLVLAAALAPELGGNALRASARTTMGVALAGSAVVLIRTQAHAYIVVAAMLAGGFVATGLGAWELAQGDAVPALDVLRERVTRVGPFLRLTGTFDHANQASMYIEATAPLLVALVAVAWAAGRRRLAGLGALALAFYVQAAILTYSRAGVVTLMASSILMATLLWPARGSRPALPWLGAGGLVAVLLLLTATVDPATRMRFVHGSPDEWYRVELRAPPVLDLVAGQVQDVPIELVNEGAFVWSPTGDHPVQLAAVWTADTVGASRRDVRWPLPHAVAPGGSARFSVPLLAPRSGGSYRVEWDLVHEDVTWFVAATGQRFETRVTVTHVEGAPPAGTRSWSAGTVAVRELAPIAPGRRVLWSVAATEIRAHPWTGVGLDNFRLRYGRHLGWSRWNESVHSNNLYIETFVSAGLVGGVIFLLWLAVVIVDLFRVLRSGAPVPLTVGVAAALAAFLIHGLLDYFLLFHATGLLFWLLVGLWVVSTRVVGGRP